MAGVHLKEHGNLSTNQQTNNMKTNETNVAVLAEKIKELDTRVINTLLSDMNAIFKKSKKKGLTSGKQSFNEFCQSIANNLHSRSIVKSLIEKYNLA